MKAGAVFGCSPCNGFGPRSDWDIDTDEGDVEKPSEPRVSLSSWSSRSRIALSFISCSCWGVISSCCATASVAANAIARTNALRPDLFNVSLMVFTFMSYCPLPLLSAPPCCFNASIFACIEVACALSLSSSSWLPALAISPASLTISSSRIDGIR